MAQTRHVAGPAGATYVVDDDAERYGLLWREVGMALGQLRQITGSNSSW